MWLQIIFLILVYCLSTTISIVIVGDRSLISGNLFKNHALINLLFNCKFIVAMCFAILSRISFVLLNNSFLQVPRLASISSTLTTFVTLLSLAFVVFANFFFLNEKLNTQQLIGAVIILVGIIVIVK